MQKLSTLTSFAIISLSDKTVPSIHLSIIAFNNTASSTESHTAGVLARFMCSTVVANTCFLCQVVLGIRDLFFCFFFLLL